MVVWELGRPLGRNDIQIWTIMDYENDEFLVTHAIHERPLKVYVFAALNDFQLFTDKPYNVMISNWNSRSIKTKMVKTSVRPGEFFSIFQKIHHKNVTFPQHPSIHTSSSLSSNMHQQFCWNIQIVGWDRTQGLWDLFNKKRRDSFVW